MGEWRPEGRRGLEAVTKWNRSLIMLAWLVVVGLGPATGRYRGGYQRRRYVKRYRPLHRPGYQSAYDRVYGASLGLSAGPVLALSGVGYVANSGGALHVVG